jgi:hypothetical protein
MIGLQAQHDRDTRGPSLGQDMQISSGRDRMSTAARCITHDDTLGLSFIELELRPTERRHLADYLQAGQIGRGLIPADHYQDDSGRQFADGDGQ